MPLESVSPVFNTKYMTHFGKCSLKCLLNEGIAVHRTSLKNNTGNSNHINS